MTLINHPSQATTYHQQRTTKITNNNNNMATRKTILLVAILLVIIFSMIFPLALSRSHHNDQHMSMSQWCDQTPHPGPCNYFITHVPDSFAPVHRPGFRTILIEVALARAIEARRHVGQLGPGCETGPKKAAWTDCLKLFDDTVYHLNRTLTELGQGGCSDLDAQTWLSSAMTNLDTCLSGSSELNVTDSIGKVAAGFNVTEMISNGLAINSELAGDSGVESFYGGEFPGWVSSGERRLLAKSKVKGEIVVAKDGSGHFRTVQEAINAASRRRVKSRIVIHVKRGVYRENIEVGVGNNNIMLVGDGMRFTIITGGRSVNGGYTTFSSATAGIDGLRFIARGITFRNTAGPQNAQAVALRSSSDLSVFYRCAFEGYQDTLMVHSQRQFYKECYIYGTIDFIFGNAAVVLQNCIIYVRKPIKGQANVITAQGRNDPYQNTAISIHNSQIRAAADLKPVVHKFKTYLGRPWKLYSRTVFMKCYLDSLVSPLGWLEWEKSGFGLKSLYYGEYRNVGPASSTRHRVRWPGFHVITNPSEALRFSVDSLIAGKSWLPATGVPYIIGI